MRLWFDCAHKNTTFPITLPAKARKVPAGEQDGLPGTYIACLDCGRELPYSWETMTVLKPARFFALRSRPSAATRAA